MPSLFSSTSCNDPSTSAPSSLFQKVSFWRPVTVKWSPSPHFHQSFGRQKCFPLAMATKMVVAWSAVYTILWPPYWGTVAFSYWALLFSTKHQQISEVWGSVVFRWLRNERGGKRFSHTWLGAWVRVYGGSQVTWDVRVHFAIAIRHCLTPPTRPSMSTF